MRKKYFYLPVVVFYFLFASVSFAQTPPFIGGVVGRILFGVQGSQSGQRPARQSDSQQQQTATVLFTGPSWCGPCKAEWNSGRAPNVEAIVIIEQDGEAWIFPKKIFGDKFFLDNDINQQIALKYGGKKYIGSKPSSVPTTGTVPRSALPSSRPSVPTPGPSQPTPTQPVAGEPATFSLEDCKPFDKETYVCVDKLGRKFTIPKARYENYKKEKAENSAIGIDVEFIFNPSNLTTRMDFKTSSGRPTPPVSPAPGDGLKLLKPGSQFVLTEEYIVPHAPKDKFDVDVTWYCNKEGQCIVKGKICSKGVEPGFCVEVNMMLKDIEEALPKLLQYGAPSTPPSAAPAKLPKPTPPKSSVKPPTSEDPAKISREYKEGSWNVIETQNVRVLYTGDRNTGVKIAQDAEKYRVACLNYFKCEVLDWQPKVDIFLHPTAAGYARATGQGPQSPGHSRTVIDQGRILNRRVDLNGESDMQKLLANVLPHELGHVTFVVVFGAHKPLPRWADEGLAVVTQEPEAVANAHLLGLKNHIKSGQRLFSVKELMTMHDYPSGPLWGLFYGESTALVKFFLSAGSVEQFKYFMKESLQGGYEPALRKRYNINNFEDLDKRFKKWLQDNVVNNPNI